MPKTPMLSVDAPTIGTCSACQVLARLVLIVMALTLVGCAPMPATISPQSNEGPPAPTQTALAGELKGTLTAKAPTATSTPTAPPTEMEPLPTQTPTPNPTPSEVRAEILPMLAFVRLGADETANVVVRDLLSGDERVLTHFAGPLGIFDLKWSPGGNGLILVSAHNYLASRENERNVFTVQSDGTDLRMVTGDVMPPNEATGPFISITGTISGTTGACYVSAQGAASPATADARGVFTLTGVPETASWVRAVCAPSETTAEALEESDSTMPVLPSYQGSLSLTASVSTALTVTLSVHPGGTGWRQASLAPEGDRFCGVRYTWTVDEEGAASYQAVGLIYDIATHATKKLELPDGATIQNLTWSPLGGVIAGAYRKEQGSYLALWDTSGNLLETIVEIPDTDSIIMTAKDVCWSRDGTRLTYALQQHYWWEDPSYKTEIWMVSLEDPTPQIITSLDWGEHATHPSLTADGRTLYYDYVRNAENKASPPTSESTLRAIATDGTGRSYALLDEELAILPAAHPLCSLGDVRIEDVIGENGP